MANTTNFGWETPDDTDLVKDGAAAIRTLGSAIDTSLVDLKGGTTGQVLSKASNTDMDFTWVAQDDSNAIQNALLTTTGDTIYASSASTPARLGIGSTGQVLTVNGGVPTWATPSSGSMTLISTTTLSGSSITLSSIPSTYKDLRIIIRNFLPATDSARMWFRFNGDGNARYAWTNTVNSTNNSMSSNQIAVAQESDNAVGNGLIDIFIPDYTNSTTWKWLIADSVSMNPTTNTNASYGRFFGMYNQTAAITSIGLGGDNPGGANNFGSGNFTSGTVLFYGVN